MSKTFKADVTCETEGCAREGQVINTIIGIQKEKESAFYEGYGHGTEDAADYCPECKQLGILQDPKR